MWDWINTQVQADYQSAVTNMKLARTKYERSKLLLNQAVSQQELATLKADMEGKEATVKSKLSYLNQKVITAPFPGVLGVFHVQVGDYVKAGDSLVTLNKYNPITSRLSIARKFFT
ncbi:efflux RND transporter periplasmic adaptor subunit [Coxiella endosymbiont of Dermacentor marginatus]|uniref:hypothetical protein n=1 Tax=Coxiella endosymbiont of Dermacentor marginatus TaxID=1656159 RepID=UPI002223D360|nr:hypothetical protein [Coxiella endosymbiont of Dermacentor marginatus]